MKRPRFTEEFRQEAVKQVLERTNGDILLNSVFTVQYNEFDSRMTANSIDCLRNSTITPSHH